MGKTERSCELVSIFGPSFSILKESASSDNWKNKVAILQIDICHFVSIFLILLANASLSFCLVSS